MSESSDRALLEGLLRYYPRSLLWALVGAADEAARAAATDRSPDEISMRALLERGRIATWTVPRWRGW